MNKKNRTSLERTVDQELIAKGKAIVNDFDKSQIIHMPAKKRTNKLISIRLPMNMIKQLRNVAMKKGDIGYQQLIKIYLAEALARETGSNIATIVVIQEESQDEAKFRWRRSVYPAGGWSVIGETRNYYLPYGQSQMERI